eukprot:scaffold131904_cov17-Prasinocladus_malaysianus.AAC.1
MECDHLLKATRNCRCVGKRESLDFADMPRARSTARFAVRKLGLFGSPVLTRAGPAVDREAQQQLARQENNNTGVNDCLRQ